MPNSHRIHLVQGDITKVHTEAIVNAANTSLLGGGGVDGAIHRAGGRVILEECRKIVAKQGGCKTGEAVITSGGQLPAKYVIHTVGPVWQGGHKGEPDLLARCYHSSLALAAQHDIKSIAFPNISTGAYGYPKDQAARIAVETVQQYLDHHAFPLEVSFVVFDAENLALYQRLLKKTA